MEADELEPNEQPTFALALRRGDEDAPQERAMDPSRRFDFIPILSPAVLEEHPRERRFGEGLRRVMPGLLAVALIGTLVVGLGRGGREQQPPRPQKLLASAPVVPDREAVGRAAIAVQDEGPDVEPRVVRVAVKQKKKKKKKKKGDPGRGARRTSVTLASADSTAPATDGEHQEPSSAPKKGTAGNKTTSSSAPKPPPQPSRSLYHLYKGGNKNDHWFTTSAAERDDRISRGYEMVDVEGFVFGKAQEGTLTLNTDNGPAGFIYEEPRDGYIPLYMFRGYNGYGDLFTSDEARIPEYEEQGWNPYGIVGYVLPAR